MLIVLKAWVYFEYYALMPLLSTVNRLIEDKDNIGFEFKN